MTDDVLVRLMVQLNKANQKRMLEYFRNDLRDGSLFLKLCMVSNHYEELKNVEPKILAKIMETMSDMRMVECGKCDSDAMKFTYGI